MSTNTAVIALSDRSHTLKLVSELKQSNEDFEFYPTTPEIIECIKDDLKKCFLIREGDRMSMSILDCGAGDGRVLKALTDGNKYAIEKAQTLITALTGDIFIVGTDFNQQTLIDKSVDVVVSNPPYSSYEHWACKIITEANAPYVYLVIPNRWKQCQAIEQALEMRRAETTTLASFDFERADRQARAKVDVIRVDLGYAGGYRRNNPKVDPFSIWFKQNFSIEAHSRHQTDLDTQRTIKKRVEETVSGSSQVVKNDGLVNVLERFYQSDMSKLMDNYKRLAGLDTELLKELNVEVHAVSSALELKIKSHKATYWQELFNNLESITSRLSTKSRESMLNTLQANTHIDFTASNAHAIALWVLKNANSYFDTQLIDFVERMVEKANIILYKSNKKTFGDEEWRYCRKPSELSHYKLDYRVVLEHMGGLSGGYEAVNGLSKYAANFINDVCVIAHNLGFDTESKERATSFEWVSNKKQVFHFHDHVSGKEAVLFEAKAFKNGNLHIKFTPEFICKLNTEFGRLKGWLKSAKQAQEELDITIDQATASFRCNAFLTCDKLDLLGFNPE